MNLIKRATRGMYILLDKIEINPDHLEIIINASQKDGVIFKFTDDRVYLIRVKIRAVYRKVGENWLML